MITTGSKFFYALAGVLLVAAVVYGYSTGGGEVGPLSLGYKGGVGDHLGYGILESLGAPTGKRVQVMGMTHFHIKDGRIVDEWNVYDELSLLTQVKLAEMADQAA